LLVSIITTDIYTGMMFFIMPSKLVIYNDRLMINLSAVKTMEKVPSAFDSCFCISDVVQYGEHLLFQVERIGEGRGGFRTQISTLSCLQSLSFVMIC